MKFTDGYWLRKENVKAFYAVEAFDIQTTEHGLRIVATEREVHSRADTIDVQTLVIDIESYRKNDISVTITHFMGYDIHEARLNLNTGDYKPETSINEEQAVLQSGDVKVIVNRKNFSITFYGDEKKLTSSEFRNIGYMQVDHKPARLDAHEEYFQLTGHNYILNELSVKAGETIYGLGERFTAFVKNGQSIDMWNEDGGTASSVAYKNIPFYISSENYGIFANHAGPVSFEVCSEKTGYVSMSIEGEQLRYHLFYGKTPSDIIELYTDLTGKPALPPAWSFGLWLSTSFKPMYDEETVTDMINGMDSYQIPFRVFHFDCYWMKALHWCDFEWDDAQFPDVKGMLERYHQRGLKICVWINPYVAQNTEMFEEGMKNGYFLMRKDGKGIRQFDNWQPGMALVDFTNPEACVWYTSKLKQLIDVGVDCFKTDFGERIPIDVVYHDGSDSMSMHNYYTYLYNQCVFTFLEKEKGKNEAVLFARSATSGCQQFQVHWGGDCSANYASMAETLRGGLSFALGGFAFWSHDISGFESTATPDVYKRWLQFGMFSTHSRLHGSDTYRVPWLFDAESCAVARQFSSIKNRLMPYYWMNAVKAHQTGIPVMRPMFFNYPDDMACRYLDMQYMLGDSMIVAPIFNEQGRADYYLPQGEWYNLLDDTVKEGCSWYSETYDYFHLPVFIKENTLMAIGTVENRPDYDYLKHSELYWFLPKGKAECEIWDEKAKRSIKIYVKEENGRILMHSTESYIDWTIHVYEGN